jgi:hypothetical protein
MNGEKGVARYLSSDPKIAIHSVAAKYAVGDGDAATIETQLTTSVVLIITPLNDGLRSPIKRCTPG